ncbi:MAG: DUF721 domain-containing protein [Bacteroidetes bacterium]|nr:DUF721 domain-containing protein [Bacteroidota bacterium]MBL0053275.1 DUF721 domain-containing protein [Bacteroidota bacterium]
MQSEENNIKNLIGVVITQNKLKSKLNEVRIREAYEKVMGHTINIRTTEVKLYGTKLSIAVNSAPLKAEMTFSKNKIIALLNAELGDTIIEDIWIK